jgi:protein-S-isoprenylcysteine O-methyltransferase Ste14
VSIAADTTPPVRARGSGVLRPERAWPRSTRLTRAVANLVGAGGAAYFAAVTLQGYLETGRLLGVALFVEQLVVVAVYLVRRPARALTERLGDWCLAFGGTFLPVLFRPEGVHPAWGVSAGFVLQLVGLAICASSLLVLGRSFGFAAADRGLVRRGPYAVVRHPVYAGYILLQGGYVLQSISLRNIFVFVAVTAFNVGRSIVEERVLAANPDHAAYRTQVVRRLVPFLW